MPLFLLASAGAAVANGMMTAHPHAPSGSAKRWLQSEAVRQRPAAGRSCGQGAELPLPRASLLLHSAKEGRPELKMALSSSSHQHASAHYPHSHPNIDRDCVLVLALPLVVLVSSTLFRFFVLSSTQ